MRRDHGTLAGYRAGCKCFKCRLVAANDRREYEQRVQAGERFTYRPDEARAHVRRLLDAGMSKMAIAESADVTTQMLRDLLKGNTGRILARSHHGIMGVSLDDSWLVPGWRVRLMVAYMQRAGISTDQIADALHTTRDEVRKALCNERHQPRTFARYVTLYRHLAGQGVVRASVLEEVAP